MHIITLIYMLFASQFDLEAIYIELSMDTYPYGMNASPLIKTVGGKHPKIDSIANDHLYGTVGKRRLEWDSVGVCVKGPCAKGDTLTWSDIWLDPPN